MFDISSIKTNFSAVFTWVLTKPLESANSWGEDVKVDHFDMFQTPIMLKFENIGESSKMVSERRTEHGG